LHRERRSPGCRRGEENGVFELETAVVRLAEVLFGFAFGRRF